MRTSYDREEVVFLRRTSFLFFFNPLTSGTRFISEFLTLNPLKTLSPIFSCILTLGSFSFCDALEIRAYDPARHDRFVEFPHGCDGESDFLSRRGRLVGFWLECKTRESISL